MLLKFFNCFWPNVILLFKRKFVIEVPDSVSSGASSFSSSDNSALQAKLDLIQKQLELVTAKLAKGKGRGKKSKPTTPPQEASRPGLLNRLRTSISGPSTSTAASRDYEASETSSSINDDELPPPSYSDVIGPQQERRATKTKTIYIQNVQLLLNGVGLDQIETIETEGKKNIR